MKGTNNEHSSYPNEQQEILVSLRSVSDVIAWFMMLLILFSVLSGFLYSAAGAVISEMFEADGVTYQTVFDAFDLLIYTLSFLIPLFLLFLICRKRGCLPRIPFRASFQTSALPEVFACVGIISVLGILGDAFLSVIEKTGIRIYEYENVLPETPLQILLYFLSTVIFPAFVEELVFRGMVLHMLLPYGKVPAILVSGILFGMMHAYLPQLLYASAAGVLIGYFVVHERSIWIGIFIHMTNNLISFLYDMAYCFLKEAAYTHASLLIQGIVYLAAFAGILILFRRSSERGGRQSDYDSTDTSPLDTGTAVRSVFTVPMILYLLVFSAETVINSIIF